MVEVQIINNNIGLVKAISKEELLEFAKNYLKNHVYISNKYLSSAYIEAHYDLGYRDRNHIRIRKSLNSRFNQTIQLLHRKGLISRYNNNNIWKRVDPIIDKSLSNGNGTKLVYFEGRFVNPKFYELE